MQSSVSQVFFCPFSVEGSAGVRFGSERKEEEREVPEGREEETADGKINDWSIWDQPEPLSALSVSSLPQSEERAQFEILKAQMFAERAAKRERRPKKARAMPEDEPPLKGQKHDTLRPDQNLQNHEPNWCRLTCFCLQQPIRKQQAEAGSRCLMRNWPTPAGSPWKTTEPGETGYILVIYWLSIGCLLIVCYQLAMCFFLTCCLSSSGHPSQTGSASAWTGSGRAAPGKPHIWALVIVLFDPVETFCFIPQVQEEEEVRTEKPGKPVETSGNHGLMLFCTRL